MNNIKYKLTLNLISSFKSLLRGSRYVEIRAPVTGKEICRI